MPEIIDHKVKIKGIDTDEDKLILTEGQIHVTINTDEQSVSHLFHMVDKISLPYDGILGNDMFNALGAVINYNDDTLKLKDRITFKMRFNEPVYTIAPRSEAIIECSVMNPDIREGIVTDHHISDTLLVANCIVSVKSNNRVNISVVNTSENPVTLNSNLKLNLEPFDIHSCVPIPKENPKVDVTKRTKDVLNLLRVPHLNQEESEALFEICSNYSDIFHLPGRTANSNGCPTT